MTRISTLLLSAIGLSLAGCTGTPPAAVASAEAACTVTTARVTAARGLTLDHVAMCDHIREGGTPEGYYVLGLRAHCREALCGSTLMGWFAVETATGAVFEWDVVEWRPGPEVDGR